MNRVTVYMRVGCSLCDVMLDELKPLEAAFGLRVETVDIDRDPVLAERLNDAVPVLVDGEGRELCRHFLDGDAVRRRFAPGRVFR